MEYSNTTGIDPKVSVLQGEDLKSFTRFKRSVEASVLGCETDEQKKALGPRLYKNLLALNNSISVLVEQESPQKYAGTDGAKKLIEFLESQRFAKTGFREMPKVYDKFYEQVRFENKGSEPMAAFCTSMEVAKRDLEEVDSDTKVSANALGYLVLKKSGLTKDERNLVLARAEETFDFAKVFHWSLPSLETRLGNVQAKALELVNGDLQRAGKPVLANVGFH